MISFQDYFRILPDCIDPLFGCHLLSCPGKDRQFCFFRLLIVPHIIVLLTFRSFPTMIKISSSHWTLPPFPETFVCLFLIGDSILQYLFLFVNYFLKIYFYFLYFVTNVIKIFTCAHITERPGHCHPGRQSGIQEDFLFRKCPPLILLDNCICFLPRRRRIFTAPSVVPKMSAISLIRYPST